MTTEPVDLQTLLDSVDAIRVEVNANHQVLSNALTALRTMIVQHYHAVQTRADDHARRVARLEAHLSLPPLPPEDPPRALTRE